MSSSHNNSKRNSSTNRRDAMGECTRPIVDPSKFANCSPATTPRRS